MFRIAGIVLIVISLGVFGYWGATGAHFTTQYQVLVETEVEDDFGDKVKKSEMVDKFQFGLNPTDKLIDGALPIGGTFGGLGVALLVFGFIRGRKQGGGATAA